jgi:drug/metabolite transporter (DMT)-like permease
MIGAIVSFTSMAVAGRAVAVELDTFELMLYRSVIGIGLVLCAASAVGTLGQIKTHMLGTHALRNLSHFAGQNLWFAAITLAPLSQVIALEFTGPIWIVLLAPIFLGEKLTRLRITVAILGFIGAMMVARPDVSQIEFGVLFAALAAIGFAGSAIFTKILTRHVSVTCILFWLTIMQSVFGLICAGFDGDIAWPSSAIWPWVIVVSVAGLCAHFCLTQALSIAPATIVMPFDFLRLPIIAAIGYAFYNEALDPWVISGAVIIIGANYLNISAENQRNKQAKSA